MRPLMYLAIVSLPVLQSLILLPVGGLSGSVRSTQEIFTIKDTRQQVAVHFSYAEGRKISGKATGPLLVKKSFTLQNNTDKPQEFSFLHSSLLTLSTNGGELQPNESLTVDYSFQLAQPSSDIRFAAIYLKGDGPRTRRVLELRTSWKPPFHLKNRRTTFSNLGEKGIGEKEIPLNVLFKEFDGADVTLTSSVSWLDHEIVDRAGQATLKVSTNDKIGFGLGILDIQHKPTGYRQHLLIDLRRQTRIRAIPPVVIQNPNSKKYSPLSVVLRGYRAKKYRGKMEADGGELEISDQSSLGQDLLVELKLTGVKPSSKKVKIHFEGYPKVEIPILRGFQLDESQPVFEFENIDAAQILIDSVIQTQMPLWPRRTFTQQTYGYGPSANIPTKKGAATEMTYRWDLFEHPNGSYIENTKNKGILSGGQDYSSERTWISVHNKNALYVRSKPGIVNVSPKPPRNAYYRHLDLPFFSRSFDELISGRLKEITINWEKPKLRSGKTRTVLQLKGELASNQKPPVLRYELEFDPDNYLALVSAKTYRIENNRLINECNVREWLTKPGLFGIPGKSTWQSYDDDGKVRIIRQTQLLGAQFYNNSSFQREVEISDKDSLLGSDSPKQK